MARKKLAEVKGILDSLGVEPGNQQYPHFLVELDRLNLDLLSIMNATLKKARSLEGVKSLSEFK